MFAVEKDEASHRPIINLKILNQFLVVPSFKMETDLKIAMSILSAKWGCKIDLKDAYFHVPIAWAFRNTWHL